MNITQKYAESAEKPLRSLISFLMFFLQTKASIDKKEFFSCFDRIEILGLRIHCVCVNTDR